MSGQSRERPTESAQDALVSRYIEVPTDAGPGGARLVDYGVDVWVLVVYFQHAAERNAATVAQAYQIPIEAVRVAIAYYNQHRKIIDAVIKINLGFAA